MASELETLEALRELTQALQQQTPAPHERSLQYTKAGMAAAGGGGTGTGPSVPIEVVDFFRDGLNPGMAAGFDTFVLIDRDNSTGNYTHRGQGFVQISAAGGHLVKIKANDSWEASLCVVLRIDAADADMAILEFNSLHANDTQQFQATRDTVTYPLELNLTVLNGELRNVTPAQIILNDPTVNTTAGLEDATGEVITPEVGDVLIRTTRIMGNGAAQVEFSAWYRMAGQ